MSGNLGVGSRQHSAITTWVWSISCLLLMGELIGDQVGSSSWEGHSAIQMGLPCMLQAPLGRARGRGPRVRLTARSSLGLAEHSTGSWEPVLSCPQAGLGTAAGPRAGCSRQPVLG